MSKPEQPAALLPSGLRDLTGDEALLLQQLTRQFMEYCRGFGYQPMQPPLMEFSTSLFGGQDNSPLAHRSFRVMDPASQQLMALRADMTMQIARIAGTRLKEAPRPLRACYAGPTLRSTSHAMRQSRQFTQMGIERFGCASRYGLVEILQLSIGALAELDLTGLTLDIAMPQLLPPLLQSIESARQEELIEAIRHKNCAAIEELGAPDIAELAAISGPIDEAIRAMEQCRLKEAVKPLIEECNALMQQLQARLSLPLTVTLDPLEIRGFGYYTGTSFALYAPTLPYALGRGGQYTSPYGEDATGFTFYAEDVLSLLPPSEEAAARLLVPATCPQATARHWQAEGYITCYAQEDESDVAAEAARQSCQYWLALETNTINAVDEET